MPSSPHAIASRNWPPKNALGCTHIYMTVAKENSPAEAEPALRTALAPARRFDYSPASGSRGATNATSRGGEADRRLQGTRRGERQRSRERRSSSSGNKVKERRRQGAATRRGGDCTSGRDFVAGSSVAGKAKCCCTYKPSACASSSLSLCVRSCVAAGAPDLRSTVSLF